ncbi:MULTISPECIES: thioredoxin domain-containing protein [unclassified Leptolyngbya]|uniref:DsbA family protein n=1 Tax=unclassified Leptolyngbya TaxID=2650499 RepID=UPI00168392F9|nr:MULTISPECIES: thioredoxin domain-containing protein [unclassified Leptolyngbya]MBD1914074.1 DsbA family protein [Leptolyngbya sp. FACHB-8]MBD2152994.1 DsbA family protein [Leptolyngbya sp. FACHB-16]
MVDDHRHHFLFVPPSIQDHIQGVLSATAVLVLYGDYECSQSADVYRLIKVAQQQLSPFPDKNNICFIFRHFPQIQIHPHAQRAAEAAEAAAIQGQFWQMHEMLFIHQQMLENGYLVEYAERLGLDISQFLQDLSHRVHIARVNLDAESGYRSGIKTAPALFINGIRYTDQWNIKKLIASIINAAN